MDPESLRPGQVETYSGFRLHERPRSFTWEGEWVAVRQVLARWSTPEQLYFLVAAVDGHVYLLKYQQVEDTWEVRRWQRPR